MKTIKQLFTHSLFDDDREPITAIWVGDEDRAVYINQDSAKVHASISHDGYRKYNATLFVSPFGARRVMRNSPIHMLRLFSFPRIAVELLSVPFMSMADAQDELLTLLAELRII